MSLEVIFNIPHTQIKKEQKDVLRYLCDLVQAKNVLEVGCWLGESTSILAEEVKKRGGTVTCVDWWNGNPGTNLEAVAGEDIYLQFITNMTVLGLSDNIRVIRGKSEEEIPKLADKSFDLVFIDADHRYSSVKSDILACYPKVRSRGILCGHDCEGTIYDENYIEVDCHESVHHGVCKAVYETLGRPNIDREVWWTRL